MKLENTFIHIIGFAGMGKYTIAKEIAALTNARIIDNHLINNPIFNVIDLQNGAKLSDEIWQQAVKIRSIVYETIEKFSPRELSFIFTNNMAKDNVIAEATLKQIIALAERRNTIYVPVRLSCDLEENLKRVMSPERADRMKAQSKEKVLRHYNEDTLIEISHKNGLNLDVTTLPATDAAKVILQHAEQCSI